MTLEHHKGVTYHRRLGDTKNTFSYGVDYLLTDVGDQKNGPVMYSRNRTNFLSMHDRDHGGPRGNGRGLAWVHSALNIKGVTIDEDWRVLLLAQPRVLGTKFSPVSFWLIVDGMENLRVVLVEVNNTFGERHSYLCALPDLRPIRPTDSIHAKKVFHVSPFQPVEGDYRFSFDVAASAIEIIIDYRHAHGGLLATLKTSRRPLTNRSILGALVRRPFGSIRVLTLIHYQALRLWLKGAIFKSKPEPPKTAVS
jgi:DUF1365 family protein